MPPTWGFRLEGLVEDHWVWRIARLANYDPVLAARYDAECTREEIATMVAIQAFDNQSTLPERRGNR